MARTQYTVTFPAANSGDDVTWPSSVTVYPDAQSNRPLLKGQLDETKQFTGWSEAASIAFTSSGKTVTVTTGSPTGSVGTTPVEAGGLKWTTAPTDGQLPAYDTATGLFTPRTIA